MTDVRRMSITLFRLMYGNRKLLPRENHIHNNKPEGRDDVRRTHLKRTNPRIPAVMVTLDAASTATTITHVATMQSRQPLLSRRSRALFTYLLTVIREEVPMHQREKK